LGSSLVFLGIGVILFIITYGILFQMAAAILGAFFTVIGDTFNSLGINSEWTTTYGEIDDLSQYLLPLIMSLGIVITIIKVIMVAGGRGAD